MRHASPLRVGRAMALRLAILIAVLVVCGPGLPHAAALYTVAGVRADVTAANAVSARQQAIEQAERDGLTRLLRELTAEDEAGRLPSTAALPLEAYVQSYEVASEKVGPTRYIATINVSYRPDAVQGLLRSAGLAYVDQQSEPILVVPAVEQSGGTLGLWADNAAWRQAWAAAVADESLLRLVLPLGDIDDIASLSPAAAEAGDAQAFAQLAQRYQVTDVVLAVATPSTGTAGPTDSAQAAGAEAPPAALSVVLRAFGGNALPTERIAFDATAPATGAASGPAAGEDIWATAARAAIDRLQSSWKTARGIVSGPSSTITVTVPLADLATWVQILHQVDSMSEVREVRVASFARDRAEVALTYAGDVGKLKDALGRHGLELSSENNQWRLLLVAGQPAPQG